MADAPMSSSESGTVQLGRPVEAARSWRRNLVFAAPADDPRARRPIDAVVLVASIIGTALAAWTYRSGSDFDARILRLFANVPDWMTGLAVVTYALVGIYCIGLIIGIGVFGRGRRAVTRDMLLAAGLAVTGIFLASWGSGAGFPEVLPEFRNPSDYPAFPVTRMAAAWAAIGVAGPFLTAPLRRLGRRLVAAGALAAIVLSYGTVSSVIGGLLVGVMASAAVHLVFGSGRGIPSRDRITAALGLAGLEISSIEYLDDQASSATLVRAEQPVGPPLFVKIYGRDAADAAFAARVWRSVWFRGADRTVTASRVQLAEHEAFAMLLFERAGIPGSRLVSGARASTDDVVLVSEWVDGPSLSEIDDLDDETLSAVWGMVEAAHGHRHSHGNIDRDVIKITAGGPAIVGLQRVAVLASDDDIASDRAQLLAATALAVGPERAVDAAVAAVAADELTAALPVLQPGAFPRSLQADVNAHDLELDDLRSALAERLGVDPPEMAKLYRVSWGALAMALLTAFAAYSLITSLTSIGLDTIADQYSEALWAWIVVAFLLAQATNVGEILTLSAVIGRPVPFGPTLMYRYAISFISLAVPSDAGAIAMSVRYQQKLGVSTAAAIAQGPFLTIVSKVVDVVLLLISAQFVGRTLDLDDVDTGSVVALVEVVLILGVIGVIVAAVVPAVRSRVLPHLKAGISAVAGSLRDPHRLGKLMFGTVLQKILFAMTLSASVAAFGADVSFAEAMFVNLAVSLFVGLVPVPGGIGVAESALSAGLVVVGIPAEIAFAAAITHRMVTAYIPPVLGWWCSRWLTRHSYL